MVRIAVPRAPRDAYNPDRPAGTLLRRQLEHLEWAVRPARERAPGVIRVPDDLTEGEAADRIQALMTDLRRQTVGREPVIKGRPKARRRVARAKPRKRARGRGSR